MDHRSIASDNTREIFVWRRDGGDEARLTAVIAEQAIAELFNEEGQLVYLRDGRSVRVNVEKMREIVNRHVVSQRLVNRGTVNEPRWDIEYYSFEFPVTGTRDDLNHGPNDRTLLKMINDLVPLMTRAPRRPVELRPQQRQEIQARLRTGEPAAHIALSYHVDADDIRDIQRAG